MSSTGRRIDTVCEENPCGRSMLPVAVAGSGAASSAATWGNLESNHFSITASWGAGACLCQLKFAVTLINRHLY
jgi:hypothetical protein